MLLYTLIYNIGGYTTKMTVTSDDILTIQEDDNTVLKSFNDINPITGEMYDGWNLTCKENLDTSDTIKKG